MAMVLVVEDHEPTCRTLVQLLTLLGHRARCVMDGETALELCRSVPPCLVILDLMLRLRADPATADTPVVVYTALSDSDTHSRALAGGAQALLVKARSSLEEIREVVSRLLPNCP